MLDIWATWCIPCVKGLDEIATLYAEAKGKSLVLLSVNQDEDENTANDFLAKKNYAWPNFHHDGGIWNELGMSGIPRTLLIDAQGKIVYDASGGPESDLRSAIAKLDPEYTAACAQAASSVQRGKVIDEYRQV